MEPHTRDQRFEKIEQLINAVYSADSSLAKQTKPDPFVSHALANLSSLASEAERCLQALKQEKHDGAS